MGICRRPTAGDANPIGFGYWLRVPYEERELARSMGAKWSPDRRCWWARAGGHMPKLEQWKAPEWFVPGVRIP